MLKPLCPSLSSHMLCFEAVKASHFCTFLFLFSEFDDTVTSKLQITASPNFTFKNCDSAWNTEDADLSGIWGPTDDWDLIISFFYILWRLFLPNTTDRGEIDTQSFSGWQATDWQEFK